MKEYENIVNVLSGTFCMNSTKNNLSITEDRREKNVLHKLLVCILNAGKKNLTSTKTEYIHVFKSIVQSLQVN